MASTQEKMARGAAWMILFKWVERILGFLSTLILVRLLSPHDFGMVTMALSFIFMAELLTAFSFDVALIQNQKAEKRHFDTAWTANLLLGAAITCLMLALSVPIARFYKQPDVVPLICVLALGPLLTGMENIGIVAFRRELDFRKEFLFQVSRKVIAFCVTIPVAFALHSYWALVAGILASKVGGTALSYALHPFRPRMTLAEVPSLLRFSRWLLLNNLLNFLKERSTDFVIGRFFGPTPLGIYNVSNDFASIPSNEVGMPINRALLPGFAKMAGDLHGGLRKAYSHASGMIALLAIPVGAGIFAVAPYLVPVVLGKKWLEGVPVIEVLSLNSALMVFQGTAISALIVTGKPSYALRVTALYLVVMMTGLFTLTGKFGPLGSAFAVLTATLVSTPLYLVGLRKHAGVPLSNFLRVSMRPILAAASMSAVVRWFLPDYGLDMPDSRAILLLCGGVLIGAMVYACVLPLLWVAMGKPDGVERQIWDRVLPRVPAWVPVIGRKAP